MNICDTCANLSCTNPGTPCKEYIPFAHVRLDTFSLRVEATAIENIKDTLFEEDVNDYIKWLTPAMNAAVRDTLLTILDQHPYAEFLLERNEDEKD